MLQIRCYKVSKRDAQDITTKEHRIVHLIIGHVAKIMTQALYTNYFQVTSLYINLA